jgi:hypothetical protein
MIKLHLFQDIQYQRKTEGLEMETAYSQLSQSLFSIPEGGEVCLHVSYNCGDSVSMDLTELASKDPPTLEDKIAVDSGMQIPPLDNPAFSIPAGEYQFEQLVILPEPGNLEGFLYRYCTKSTGSLYLRILRENPVSFVAQIIIPY